MNHAEATEFGRMWLAAWTGNQPDVLLEFYADDAFFGDPGRPEDPDPVLVSP